MQQTTSLQDFLSVSNARVKHIETVSSERVSAEQQT